LLSAVCGSLEELANATLTMTYWLVGRAIS
jgi:hypothetical protein